MRKHTRRQASETDSHILKLKLQGATKTSTYTPALVADTFLKSRHANPYTTHCSRTARPSFTTSGDTLRYRLHHGGTIDSLSHRPPHWSSGQGKRLGSGRSRIQILRATGFFRVDSSHTSDFKIGHPVATVPGAWHYRFSTGTGRPGVSIL